MPAKPAPAPAAAMTLSPVDAATLKNGGAGLCFSVGFHATPLGTLFIADCAYGLHRIAFSLDGPDATLHQFRQRWPAAQMHSNPDHTRQYLNWLLPACESVPASPVTRTAAPRTGWVIGTDFQLRVWRALLTLPAGTCCSYQAVAEKIGQPGACRAVGSAIGRNPLAILVPCHRVIRADGTLGNYHWGAAIKAALIEQEHRAYC